MKPGWVRTYTGKHVCLTAPEPGMIDLRDIAHHLSLECRWAGATRRHYSVAEHSIYVARFSRELVPAEKEAATIHALLHDAHEAYIKDIPTPLKVLLGPGYSQMAGLLDAAIRLSLGLAPPSPAVSAAIKDSDRYASWCEARALLAPCPGLSAGLEPPEWLKSKVPMPTEILRAPHDVEHAFAGYASFALRLL